MRRIKVSRVQLLEDERGDVDYHPLTYQVENAIEYDALFEVGPPVFLISEWTPTEDGEYYWYPVLYLEDFLSYGASIDYLRAMVRGLENFLDVVVEIDESSIPNYF